MRVTCNINIFFVFINSTHMSDRKMELPAKKRKLLDRKKESKTRMDLFAQACPPDVFLIGSDSDEPVPANKAMLCLMSSKLTEIFAKDSKASTIPMKWSRASILAMVEFSFTGKCPFIPDTATDLMKLAHLYEVPRLEAQATKFLFPMKDIEEYNRASRAAKACKRKSLEDKIRKDFRSRGLTFMLEEIKEKTQNEFLEEELKETVEPAYWTAVAQQMREIVRMCRHDSFLTVIRNHQNQVIFGTSFLVQLGNIPEKYLIGSPYKDWIDFIKPDPTACCKRCDDDE